MDDYCGMLDILAINDFDYDVQKYDDYLEIVINCQSATTSFIEGGIYRGRNDKDRYDIIPVLIISFTREGKYLDYEFTQIIEKVDSDKEAEASKETD